jgi:hypothetical protein
MSKSKTYNPVDDLDVAKQPLYVTITGGNDEIGLRDGDKVIFDESLKKPKHGDVVVWEKPDGSMIVGSYDEQYYLQDGEETFRLIAIAVTLVRRFPRTTRKKSTAPPRADLKLADLRKQLDRLEFLPENEGTRFQLERKIYNLEQALTVEEWPDVIGGGDDGPN